MVSGAQGCGGRINDEWGSDAEAWASRPADRKATDLKVTTHA